MATVSWLRHRRREEASPGRDGTGSERDDAALVAAAQANPEAFSALYQRYVGPVYRFCYVRLGTPQESEDATSQGDQGAGWPARLPRRRVRRLALSHRPEHGDRHTALPAALAGARRRGGAPRQALSQLTDEQRLAIELQLAGWSGPQIAEVLGKSPQAIKMLRFRALQRLRECLTRVAGQDEEVHDGHA